mmetsp:Transcript_15960/g.43306  ORF Transcript_15960/g.43306 Transcript_15960/m.43306 type:complete len:312 (-) Transcript_15960:1263-2198(-)
MSAWHDVSGPFSRAFSSGVTTHRPAILPATLPVSYLGCAPAASSSIATISRSASTASTSRCDSRQMADMSSIRATRRRQSAGSCPWTVTRSRSAASLSAVSSSSTSSPKSSDATLLASYDVTSPRLASASLSSAAQPSCSKWRAIARGERPLLRAVGSAPCSSNSDTHSSAPTWQHECSAHRSPRVFISFGSARSSSSIRTTASCAPLHAPSSSDTLPARVSIEAAASSSARRQAAWPVQQASSIRVCSCSVDCSDAFASSSRRRQPACPLIVAIADAVISTCSPGSGRSGSAPISSSRATRGSSSWTHAI